MTTTLIPEPELDLFETDKISLGVISESYVDYRPINALDKTNFVQFSLQAAGEFCKM